MKDNDFESLFVGKNNIHYVETDSTNTRMKEYLQARNLPEGTAITAEYQTGGRGQRGAVWESGPGENILLSVLLQPVFLPLKNQFLLSQAIALGITKFLKYILPLEEVIIKWPNDILVNGKKIAGILIENMLEGSRIRYSIVGIGLNVNQEILPSGATSLYSLGKKKYVINEILNILFSFLEQKYLRLRQGDSEVIEQEYVKSMYGLGKELEFLDIKTGQAFTGTIRGTNPEGRLLISAKDGQLLTFEIKEIKFL